VNLDFYPNPVQDLLHFSLPHHSRGEYQLFDISDQLVKLNVIFVKHQDKAVLDLPNLGSGIYFLLVEINSDV